MNKIKICKCGPPYGYSPHVKGGYCRFCWGIEPKKYTTTRIIFSKKNCDKLNKTLFIK